jgi:hypothetical protein
MMTVETLELEKTFETFTVDALIERLEKIRREHGGDCPVLLVDNAPVVAVKPHRFSDCTVVYVSDLP